MAEQANREGIAGCSVDAQARPAPVRCVSWIMLITVVMFVASYVVFFFASMQLPTYTVSRARLAYIRSTNSQRWRKFHPVEEGKTCDIPPPSWESTDGTSRGVNAYYQASKLRALENEEREQRLARLRSKCEGMSDIQKVESDSCVAEWILHLERGEVVAVEEMLGFTEGKKAAMRVRFDDGRRGWFKACGSTNEWPEGEIIAAALDRVLGFNRVVPSVSRNFTRDELLGAIGSSWGPARWNERYHVLQQMFDTCGDEGTLFGTMIGWWNGVRDAKTFPKTFARGGSEEKMVSLRSTADAHAITEMTRNHAFFSFLGTLRAVGYNEYRLSSGELIALDLDRMQWDGSSAHQLSACYVCKFDRPLWEMLQTVIAEPAMHVEALCYAVRSDPLQLTIPRHEYTILMHRIRAMRDCVQNCISQYGEDDVLVVD